MGEVVIGAAVSDADIEYVASNMRVADIAEVWAMSRLSPEAALHTSVSLTTYPYIAYVDEKPAAIFGVYGSILGDIGVPWFLGTDDVKKNAAELLRRTQSFLDFTFVSYRRLENEVHAENRDAVRFLRWAGFRFSEPYKTKTGAVAHRFWMERDNV